ncbi:MAG: aminotransferase class I/II-fold pyridoxal phosphate-dependent enzyme, partial [Thermoplasmata archaeon]
LLRIGWIMASENNIEVMKNIKNIVSIANPRYSMWISDQVLKMHEKFSERAKKIVTENKKLAVEYLQNIKSVNWNDPVAAPFGLLQYEKNIDSVSLSRIAAEKYDILLSPGSFFGKEKTIRICLTSDHDVLKESLEKLAEFLKKEIS